MRTEDVPGQSALHNLFSRSPSASQKYCRKQRGHTGGVEEEGGEGSSVYSYRCMCVCVCLEDVYEREGFIFSLRIIFSASAYRLRIKNNNTLLPSTRWQIKLLSYEYNKIITFTFKTSKYQINTEIWRWCHKSPIYDNKPCTVYIYVKLELLIVQYITQEDTSLSEYTQQSYKEEVWDKTDVGNSIKAWIIVSCSIEGP